jgi:cell wall-associated NlpC family hydrolase
VPQQVGPPPWSPTFPPTTSFSTAPPPRHARTCTGRYSPLSERWHQITVNPPCLAYIRKQTPGGATPPSAYNPHDAVYTAAAYLCDNGARNNQDLTRTIYAYNPSRTYVTKVLRTADAYGRIDPIVQAPPAASPPPAPASPAQPPAASSMASLGGAAVAFAHAQLGKPYVWGGNGNPGFDCSGLTKAAYAAVGIAIPRTAQTQYNHGPRLPAGAELQPGDLFFFGSPRRIHHVGMSLGGTLMINAPTFGQTVRIQDYRNFRNYAGASRPAH